MSLSLFSLESHSVTVKWECYNINDPLMTRLAIIIFRHYIRECSLNINLDISSKQYKSGLFTLFYYYGRNEVLVLLIDFLTSLLYIVGVNKGQIVAFGQHNDTPESYVNNILL